jgi:hypothetical protein
LEDVGRWRCKGCGEMNGVESEVGKVLQQAEKKREVSGSSEVQKVPEMEERTVKKEETDDEDEDEESEEQSSGVDTTPAESTRSKARQRRKA